MKFSEKHELGSEIGYWLFIKKVCGTAIESEKGTF
jgi:hypothetical protein